MYVNYTAVVKGQEVMNSTYFWKSVCGIRTYLKNNRTTLDISNLLHRFRLCTYTVTYDIILRSKVKVIRPLKAQPQYAPYITGERIVFKLSGGIVAGTK